METDGAWVKRKALSLADRLGDDTQLPAAAELYGRKKSQESLGLLISALAGCAATHETDIEAVAACVQIASAALLARTKALAKSSHHLNEAAINVGHIMRTVPVRDLDSAAWAVDLASATADLLVTPSTGNAWRVRSVLASLRRVADVEAAPPGVDGGLTAEDAAAKVTDSLDRLERSLA